MSMLEVWSRNVPAEGIVMREGVDEEPFQGPDGGSELLSAASVAKKFSNSSVAFFNVSCWLWRIQA